MMVLRDIVVIVYKPCSLVHFLWYFLHHSHLPFTHSAYFILIPRPPSIPTLLLWSSDMEVECDSAIILILCLDLCPKIECDLQLAAVLVICIIGTPVYFHVVQAKAVNKHSTTIHIIFWIRKYNLLLDLLQKNCLLCHTSMQFVAFLGGLWLILLAPLGN